MIEQDLVIRLQAAVSTKKPRKAAIWGLVLIGIFVIGLPSVIAFCSMVIYPPGDASTAQIGSDATNICSALILKLPVWLSVFMLVGILACQMSTVDTFANVSALALAYDLVEPVLVKRKLSPARPAHVRQGPLGLYAAPGLGMRHHQPVPAGTFITSHRGRAVSACIAVPAIFIFWRRTTLPAVMVAAVVGFVGTIAGFVLEYHYLQTTDPKAPHYYTDVFRAFLQGSQGYNYIATGVLLSLLSIVTVSLITGPAKPEQLAALERHACGEL